MSQENYISQVESARKLHVSYKKIVDLSDQFPDKLPRIVKKGRKQFYFKARDVSSFKEYLDSQTILKKAQSTYPFLPKEIA